MVMDKEKSLELWERYGRNVLMVMPYDDILISRGEGCYLYDADGNRYLDMACGQLCAGLGHNHPELMRRIGEQMERLLHTGTHFLSPAALEASEKVARVTPGDLNRSIFLSTGTEANECAMRIAKTATRRTGMVGFTRGYYGISIGTRSVGMHISGQYSSSPRVPESTNMLSPDCRLCPVGSKYPECEFLCLRASDEMLRQQAGNIAAFIVEPIISAGGMVFPPPGYFRQLRELADDYGALIIADEAQTGFGRTGRWFAVEHWGDEQAHAEEALPDILVVSKSAGGGFPVAAVIVTDEVARKVAEEGLYHISSHQADPVPAAAVSAVIDIVEREGLVQRSQEMGEYFRARLEEVKADYPDDIADVRGSGLMIGLEMAGEEEGPRNKYLKGYLIEHFCKEAGVIMSYGSWGGVFRIMPPLTITEKELDEAVGVLRDALELYHSKPGDLGGLLPANPYSRPVAERMLKRFTT